MKDKKATYNKDGSIRKVGSGRKKGSNSFVKVNYNQLKEYIGEKTPILVSRVWLENLGISTQVEDIQPKVKKVLTEDVESDKILFSVKKFEEE